MQNYYALQYVSLTYIFIAIGTLQKVNTHWINELCAHTPRKTYDGQLKKSKLNSKYHVKKLCKINET
jgi:hypothetical protein